jgi:hypothetical protein
MLANIKITSGKLLAASADIRRQAGKFKPGTEQRRTLETYADCMERWSRMFPKIREWTTEAV